MTKDRIGFRERRIWSWLALSLCSPMPFAALVIGPPNVSAQALHARKPGTVTGLPVPRFVSLKADEVNSRVGPGGEYAIAWVFRRAGLPVEILAEFDNWRQVRDSEGGTGWVSASLLSGRRTAVAAPWTKSNGLFTLTSSEHGAEMAAQMEAGAIVDVVQCTGRSCEVYARGIRGWAPQKTFWGIYPDEIVK